MTHLRAARWLAPPLSLLITAGLITAGLITVGLITVGCAAADPAGTPVTTDGAGGGAAEVPFADCSTLTAPPRPTATDPAAATDLPDITLPCFAGGAPLRLVDVRGPAVLNLWASSCGPCREELPAVQRLADRTAGRLHVIGVDTNDDRDAGASFGADAGVTVPTLFDADQRLLSAVGRRALPATIFVAATGRTHVYNGPALDDAALTTLVGEHTGVAVSP